MWTEGIDIFETRLLRLGSKVCFGCGAIGRIDEILKEMKEKGVTRLLLVTGSSSCRKCGGSQILKDAFTRNNITCIHYDKVKPNPTGQEADEAVQLGRQEKVQGVFAMGGGSVIDTGKIVSALLPLPEGTKAEELFTGDIELKSSLPLAVINLTHGTGSEVNPFAVLHLRGNLAPLVSSPLFYPDWAIDDPMLTCSLSRKETKEVTMTALNYAIESVTARYSNVLSTLLARETVRLIVKYLPPAEKNPQDLTARYFLMFAALAAGVAYDNSHHDLATTPVHHPVSALKPELPHGQSVTAFLPSYIKESYPESGKTLARILQPISPELTGDPEEADAAASAVRNWLTASGMPCTLTDIGFVREDIDALVEAGYRSTTLSLLLSTAPAESSREVIRSLFEDAFTPDSTGREERKKE